MADAGDLELQPAQLYQTAAKQLRDFSFRRSLHMQKTEEASTGDKQHSLAICLTTHTFRAPAENHRRQSCGFRARPEQHYKLATSLESFNTDSPGSAPCDLKMTRTRRKPAANSH